MEVVGESKVLMERVNKELAYGVGESTELMEMAGESNELMEIVYIEECNEENRR